MAKETKDRRYNAVKSMVEVGSISGFKEIFEIIPRTMVSKDMGMNYQTFTRKVAAPDLFTIREMNFMAAQFEITPEELLKKIIADIAPKKRGK